MERAQRLKAAARGAAWPLGAASLTALATAGGVLLGRAGDGQTAVRLGAVLAAAAALGAFALVRRLEHAETAAVSDPLTGLPNRALLADRAEQALRRSRRTGEPFSLVVVDLDDFKLVNDRHGHAAGDAVLRALAGRFGATVRASDTVARLGGDEFVVLSLGARDEHEVATLVGRLRRSLREPVPVGPARVAVDASIGWAIHPADGGSTDELLTRADEQMLAAKRHPTGARPRRPGGAARRSLERALHQGRLVVHYEPIVDLASGAPVRARARVRGCATSRGVLSLVALAGSAEGGALAPALALASVADALHRAGECGEAGRPLGVAVGLPARALADGGLVEGLARALDEAGAADGLLTLELSLGDGADELEPAAVEPLARLGVRVALADVLRSGSVAALGALPLDELAVDAALVRGLTTSPADAAIVRALVEAGRELGFELAAEGVEDAGTLAELRRLGCDTARGPFVSPALAPGDLLAWLAARPAAAAV